MQLMEVSVIHWTSNCVYATGIVSIGNMSEAPGIPYTSRRVLRGVRVEMAKRKT